MKIANFKRSTYSNRGMGLEEDINVTNKYYLDNDIAVIYKKPTSVTIHKAEYPGPHEAIIREAYFKTPSTTDYNGVYKGRYIDFEAKETKSKTSFPLSNIHDHQIKHLKSIVRHGGIGFIIVRFVLLDETYLLFERDLSEFLNKEDRKSIPYEYFKEKGYLIKIKYSPRLDYLDIIDKVGGNL